MPSNANTKKNEAGVAELDYAGDLKSPSFVGSNPIVSIRNLRAFRVVTFLNLFIISQLAYLFIKHMGWFGVIPALLCLDAAREIRQDADIIEVREFGD